ncbi:hypothetical protein HCN44_002426 [Aphidius gifuensis]|uniref:Rhodopsin n=1 Tax=Aphidius gifuensis TaxID=684658 RepID=A0A834XZZ2_APHGI|nr:hypothetical protein HCN44_002426 [Aphidius gifuensis]
MFTLKDDHKNHLLFLEKQPVQVVQDFCKLAIDYLNKGPNQKIYATAAQKLDVEAEIIQASIEGLINLLLECIKHKLTIDDLKKLLLNLGFDEEKESVISQLYISKQNDISKALENTGFKLPQYHNMEWRFEVQVASRLVPSQIIPTMTLDFELKNTDSTDKIEHVTLQTDAPNLLHLCQVIENAIKEGKSQHVLTNITNTMNLLTIVNLNSVTIDDVIYKTIGPPHAESLQMHFTNQTVIDKVPAEMMHLIDKHWYQYPPMDPMWHKLLGLVMIVIGILGWTGNGIVVYIFLMTASLRTPSNLLVVNLAFSDFIMMVAMSPPMIINCYYETWVLGPLACDIYACVGSLCGCASIWTMVAIARDRYNVIVKGMAGKPLTIKLALFEILLIWSFAGVWTILPLLGWNRYVPEGNMTSCGTDFLNQEWSSKSYIVVYSCFVYFTPLFLIIYSYWFIVSTVAAHERGMREQAKKMNVASLRSGEQDSVSAEAKLAKVAITTITLWFLAWTPYLVINYSGIFDLIKLSPLFTIWGSLFAKTNACYNPIVYAISHPKFRAALNEKAPCLVCGTVDQPAKTCGASETQSTTEKA